MTTAASTSVENNDVLPEDMQSNPKLKHIFELLGEPKPHKASIQEFVITHRDTKDPSPDDDDPPTWGYLQLGHSMMMDVQHPYARYKHKLMGEWVDISDSVKLGAIDINHPELPMKYEKIATAMSSFNFVIEIQNFGTRGAKLTGTTKGTKLQYLEGQADRATFEEDIEAYMVNIKPPEKLDQNATMQGLLDIDPNQFVETTSKDKDGKTVKEKVKVDAAQRRGDEIMHLMMFNSIDKSVRDELLPNIPKLTELQQTVATKNYDFLERGGVHLLAEALKNSANVDTNIKAKIKDKWTSFMQMMQEKKPAKGQEDPVKTYGFNKDDPKDQATLTKLRGQYQEVIKWCYEAGYKEVCPEWNKYLPDSVYWFKRLAVHLISPPVLDRWLNTLNTSGDTDASRSKASKAIYEWSTKLVLLKNAAEAAGSDKTELDNLDVDGIVSYLNWKAGEHFIFAQKLDEEWLKNLKEWFKKWQDSKDFKELNAKPISDAQQMQRELMNSLVTALEFMFNPESRSFAQFNAWRKGRLPPGTSFEHISAAEFTNWLGEHNNEGYHLDKFFKDPEEVQTKTWFQKLKSKGAAGLKALMKGFMYVGTIVAFGYMVATGSLQKMDPAAIVQSVTAAASIMIEGAGRLTRWLLPKMLSVERKFVQKIMGWLLNLEAKVESFAGRLVSAVAGNITNFVRALGFVGCIAGIIISAQEMKRTANDPEAKTEHTFATIQFWLGIVEATALAAVLIAEIAGYGGGMFVMLCGLFATVVGIVAIIVVIVAFIWFRPDPMKDVKGFLKGEGKKYDVYEG